MEDDDIPDSIPYRLYYNDPIEKYLKAFDDFYGFHPGDPLEERPHEYLL